MHWTFYEQSTLKFIFTVCTPRWKVLPPPQYSTSFIILKFVYVTKLSITDSTKSLTFFFNHELVSAVLILTLPLVVLSLGIKCRQTKYQYDIINYRFLTTEILPVLLNFFFYVTQDIFSMFTLKLDKLIKKIISRNKYFFPFTWILNYC